MLHSKNPKKTEAFSALKNHYQQMKGVHMRNLFSEDLSRAEKFSISWNDFLFDYSKNIITEETMRLLWQLSRECFLDSAIESTFSGEKINQTENREVLHTALRDLSCNRFILDGHNIMDDIHHVLSRMKILSGQIETGERKGYSGKHIDTIVNIGIGGSDLGPNMATEALRPYVRKGLQIHYVSNVDASQLMEVLKNADPETTLFIIASKTFTTQETMTNAHTARKWFIEKSGQNGQIGQHFIGVTTNFNEALAFGIQQENIFEIWDWVGGRYSLWSAVGLPLCLAIGYDAFIEMLNGAQAMDEHFRNAPFEKNIPVVMALMGIWYINFFEAKSHAIIPYDHYLRKLPSYLQQADMESNGKSVDQHGKSVSYHTGPVIWGEAGTNGQHAFFQLLHQGTHLIPADFIAPAISHHPSGEHHEILLANFFAQTEALMKGKTAEEVTHELKAKGMSHEEIQFHAPFRIFPGNRPSNTLLVKKITPFNLGAMIALYEHKIFTQGIIWNIFSFDQWGVELGKQLAGKILPELKSENPLSHDSSTNLLIHTFKKMRKGFVL